MFLYQYLDALPAIPSHLTVDSYIQDESQIGFRDGSYARWAATPSLLQWLEENISSQVNLAGVQIITRDVPSHCDKRKWALNYIIDTGGDNVVTNFQQVIGEELLQPPATRTTHNSKSFNPLCSVVLKPNHWHLLNTNVLHSVVGITGVRTAITIGLNTVNPFDTIKGYNGLLSS